MAALGARERPACAQAQRTFTLEYGGEGACPGEKELLRQVGRRTSLARHVDGGADLAAIVHVQASDGAAHGSVEWVEQGARTEREVDGDNCREVVTAIGLILALALDPDADSGPITEEPEAVSPDAPAPPVMPPPPPTIAPPARRWHPGIGVAAGVTGGVAPDVRPYLGFSLELAQDRDGVWAPRLALSAVTSSGTATTNAGSADLTLWALRLGACPIELASGSWFAEPCATFEAGKLSARGFATDNAQSASATWFGPGAKLRAGFIGFGVLSLAAEAGFVAPLARDRFYFAPDDTAHRIPNLAGYVGGALGARL